MAVYEYKGLDSGGNAVAGIIDADSAKIARSRLRKQGVFPTDVHEQAEGVAVGAGGDGTLRIRRVAEALLDAVGHDGHRPGEAVAAREPVAVVDRDLLEAVRLRRVRAPALKQRRRAYTPPGSRFRSVGLTLEPMLRTRTLISSSGVPSCSRS